MPDISISDEQEAYIEALREQLDDEVPYGHVRRQDAVQYLIDHHREDGDLDISVDSVDETTAQGSGGDGSTAAGGGGTAAGDERGTADADTSTGSDAAQPEGQDGGSVESTSGGDLSGSAVEGSVQALNETTAGGEAPDGDEDDSGGEESGETGEGTATIGSAQSDKVQQMMNLMDAHSDVWEETESSEGKYRVELPDGSTENVPTKDDVRALLFKHYR